MTNYEAPKVLLTNSGEGPFGNSGPSDPYAPTATIVWTNHNSGSHSDLEIIVHTVVACEQIMVTATWNGKGNILGIGFYGSEYFADPTITHDFDGKTVTFIKKTHINANENISFSFNNVVFDSTGDDHNTSVHKGSYYEGEKPENHGLPAYEFILNVYAT